MAADFTVAGMTTFYPVIVRNVVTEATAAAGPRQRAAAISARRKTRRTLRGGRGNYEMRCEG